jgi:dCTP deaminase
VIVVGENLRGLAKANNICDERFVDECSIALILDKRIYRLRDDGDVVVRYGMQNVEDLYEYHTVENGEVILKSRECVLACSANVIRIPQGYMGLVQTKGTLARLFVAAQCSSAQIDPGFQGKITLELVNHSPFTVSLNVGIPIANVYLLRCSTDNCAPYRGGYRDSEKPLLPRLLNDLN